MFSGKDININYCLWPLQFHPLVTCICTRLRLKASLENLSTIINCMLYQKTVKDLSGFTSMQYRLYFQQKGSHFKFPYNFMFK